MGSTNRAVRCSGRRRARRQARPVRKGSGEFAAQLAAALDVEGLVDRFGGHAHLRAVGKGHRRCLADLLWAPPLPEPVLHVLAQLDVLGQLPYLGPRSARGRVLLGPERLVVTGLWITVVLYLPTDRRGASAELGGDHPDGMAGDQAVADSDPLLLGQQPRRYRAGPREDRGEVSTWPTRLVMVRPWRHRAPVLLLIPTARHAAELPIPCFMSAT